MTVFITENVQCVEHVLCLLLICFCSTRQDGSLEPEIFTERLQKELRSSPQPHIVPFLKVPAHSRGTSIHYVRHLKSYTCTHKLVNIYFIKLQYRYSKFLVSGLLCTFSLVLKDAMPVSIRILLVTSYILTIFKQ